MSIGRHTRSRRRFGGLEYTYRFSAIKGVADLYADRVRQLGGQVKLTARKPAGSVPVWAVWTYGPVPDDTSGTPGPPSEAVGGCPKCEGKGCLICGGTGRVKYPTKGLTWMGEGRRRQAARKSAPRLTR
jgi:hypothetical protein